jgi:hypothetical protein
MPSLSIALATPHDFPSDLRCLSERFTTPSIRPHNGPYSEGGATSQKCRIMRGKKRSPDSESVRNALQKSGLGSDFDLENQISRAGTGDHFRKSFRCCLKFDPMRMLTSRCMGTPFVTPTPREIRFYPRVVGPWHHNPLLWGSGRLP